MLVRKVFIILLSLSFLSCTQNIYNPTDSDFSGTELYGQWVDIKLNDGTSMQIEVDFHNKKGIYGSGKGYDWDNIQHITFDDKKSSPTNDYEDDNALVKILMLPLTAAQSAIAATVSAAGFILLAIVGGFTCLLKDCSK